MNKKEEIHNFGWLQRRKWSFTRNFMLLLPRFLSPRIRFLFLIPLVMAEKYFSFGLAINDMLKFIWSCHFYNLVSFNPLIWICPICPWVECWELGWEEVFNWCGRWKKTPTTACCSLSNTCNGGNIIFWKRFLGSFRLCCPKISCHENGTYKGVTQQAMPWKTKAG